MSSHIETIARGVCIVKGHLLVCRNRKVGNLYLPGGHIEFGETGAEALEREVLEEMGLKSKATSFLGCAEHFFEQKGRPHSEINLVYALRIPGADPAKPVEAKEGWIAFDWVPLSKLPRIGLEPAALRRKIRDWMAKPQLAAKRLATTAK